VKLWIGAGLACCPIALVLAQPEKITLSTLPKPAQTVHYRMTTETTFETTSDSTAPDAIPPMQMVAKMTMALTQTTGTADADGRFQGETAYDDFAFEGSMNGTPLPAGNLLKDLIGKKLVVSYGPDGQILDVHLPGDTPPAFAMVRQMLPDMMKLYPVVSLAVGETVTTPLEMTMPLPAPGPGPMKTTAQVRTRLVSVDTDGGDRIAHCEQVHEAIYSISGDLAPAKGSPDETLTIKMNGTGSLAINIDRHFVKRSEMQTTFDGGAGAVLRLHGVMKMTMTGTY